MFVEVETVLEIEVEFELELEFEIENYSDYSTQLQVQRLNSKLQIPDSRFKIQDSKNKWFYLLKLKLKSKLKDTLIIVQSISKKSRRFAEN